MKSTHHTRFVYDLNTGPALGKYDFKIVELDLSVGEIFPFPRKSMLQHVTIWFLSFDDVWGVYTF